MNENQYTNMLKDVYESHCLGGDVSACVSHYHELYKYVYICNDVIFKKIFGNPENEKMSIDFLNAAFDLYGDDCIKSLNFVGFTDMYVKKPNQKLIVINIQHTGRDTFDDRLEFYTDNSALHNKNYIALQMADSCLGLSSYRHRLQLKNQDEQLWGGDHMLTLINIPEFVNGDYTSDNSTLAQWLRVINGLNKENLVPVAKGSFFAQLQEKAELRSFSEDFLVHESIMMYASETNFFMKRNCYCSRFFN